MRPHPQTIEILEGKESVRKRPGMYFGPVDDPATLSSLVEQVMCAALDDAVAGRCTRITVTLNADGSARVDDDGAGFPVGTSRDGRSEAEVLMTVLHACRAARENPGVAKRFCGMGISVVNAVSESCRLQTRRAGWSWEQTYRAGKPVTAFTRVAPCEATGTTLTFLPDPTILKCRFDALDLEKRLEDIRAEAPACLIELVDERQGHNLSGAGPAG